MKDSLRFFVAACLGVALGFSLVALPIESQAQPQKKKVIGGAHNYCIESFYDRDQYNWLAFRNNCEETQHLTWIFGNESGVGSGGNTRPSGKANTGYSTDEVRRKGGYTLYVCPENYLPVDGGGRQITGGGGQYYMCQEM
jgi:hypothetical protein